VVAVMDERPRPQGETARDSERQQREHDHTAARRFDCGVSPSTPATSPTASRTAPGARSLRMRRPVHDATEAYVLVDVLGGPDGHGRAAQRALAPVRPHRVARARAPAALGRCMAADRLVPRHGHRQMQAGARCAGAGGCVVRLLAQRGLARLLHRGGTRCRCRCGVRMGEAVRAGGDGASSRQCAGGELGGMRAVRSASRQRGLQSSSGVVETKVAACPLDGSTPRWRMPACLGPRGATCVLRGAASIRPIPRA
jgi:hypothetical protein